MERTYLDKNLRRCRQKNAVLLDLAGQTKRTKGENLLPAWEQSLRGFGPEIGRAIKKNCKTLGPDPVGVGAEKEQIKIASYKFGWETDGFWRCRRQQCEIRIMPEASLEDTGLLLAKLKKIEGRILNRGRATWERPIIRIGTRQKDQERIAGAYAAPSDGMHLFFFCADDNCRLMATRAEAACAIPLEKIILHEIGHLLEPLLKHKIEILQEGVFDHMGEIKPLLEKISPHYLGTQFEALLEGAEKIRLAALEQKETIRVNGVEKNREEYSGNQRRHIASELAAETLRHFYLEPCLTGKPVRPEKTPWKNLNSFIGILCKEAEHSLKLPENDSLLFAQCRP